MTVIAAFDVGPITDIIGIPLAVLVVGLLLLIDVVDVDAEGVDGARTSTLPIPGFLANRRTLMIAAIVSGLALVGVFAARIIWIAT